MNRESAEILLVEILLTYALSGLTAILVTMTFRVINSCADHNVLTIMNDVFVYNSDHRVVVVPSLQVLYCPRPSELRAPFAGGPTPTFRCRQLESKCRATCSADRLKTASELKETKPKKRRRVSGN